MYIVEQSYFSPYNDQANHSESKKKNFYFSAERVQSLNIKVVRHELKNGGSLRYFVIKSVKLMHRVSYLIGACLLPKHRVEYSNIHNSKADDCMSTLVASISKHTKIILIFLRQFVSRNQNQVHISLRTESKRVSGHRCAHTQMQPAILVSWLALDD